MPGESGIAPLLAGSAAVDETPASAIEDLPAFLESLREPCVIRGLVSDWPLVEAGRHSREALAEYLLQHYSGAPLTTSLGPPEIQGRIGYNDSFTGFNYQRVQMLLGDFLAEIDKYAAQPASPTLYIGSSMLDHWFPGLDEENSLRPSAIKPLTSLWLGNRVVVSAHFDLPDNLACCVAGRRRFTLFPPEQLENLYVGPWDVTPAGQPVSLVDMRNPDLQRFPRFADAMQAAREVVLEPGDALFLPSMWWHHVEGLEDLNVLLNYWWRDTPAYMGTPMTVLKHAFLSIRGLAPEQRQLWKDIFDYHIFDASEDSVAHIPEAARGIHGPPDEARARALRAELLNMLNR
jgi:hypothetical protein